jgi:fatty acid desaturase
MPVEITKRDYSLIGREAKLAEERGLANAEWYACKIPRARMKELMQRRDGPAIRDTLIWFAAHHHLGHARLPDVAHVVGGSLFPCLWRALRFGVRSTVARGGPWDGFQDAVDECIALYEIGSFMYIFESVPSRWSHTRHHTDTSVVGRDPEIPAPRPPDLLGIALDVFNLKRLRTEFTEILRHSFGRLTRRRRPTFPIQERHKVYRNARIYLLIYAAVIALAVATRSILPLMYVGLPAVYGGWLMDIFSLTQHAGLAEDILDHRLNCRTIYMNPIFRFIYWEMNYHIEHHMFPMVPYHALGKLHQELKADMPKPYSSLWEAYREIIPTLIRELKDPTYFVRRELPSTAQPVSSLEPA